MTTCISFHLFFEDVVDCRISRDINICCMSNLDVKAIVNLLLCVFFNVSHTLLRTRLWSVLQSAL